MTTQATLAAEDPPPKRRRWLLPALCLLFGPLTMVIGAGLILLGVGFANATACGTGAAAAAVGLWTALAARGLKRHNGWTLIGLDLAWFWLVVRVILDWPATASNTVVVLFLIPAVTVPLGAVWGILLLVLIIALMRRNIAALRSGQFRGGSSDRKPNVAPILRLCIQLALLIGLTFRMPDLIWKDRGRKIADLTADYASGSVATNKPVEFGACSLVFLGYELTQHGTDSSRTQAEREAKYETTLADAEAELASIAAAGAQYVRVGASGDQLLESKPDQERIDDRYMAAVRRIGRGVVLVDTQHPKVLRNHRLDWPAFCQFQRKRIEYYEKRYQPDVYLVVCEPMTYHQFALTKETRFSVDAWTTQLSEMCRLVKSIQPKTRTGICLLPDPKHRPEWEVWSQMKKLPELDILSVEIYTLENFQQTEDRLREAGHPRETGKGFWIAETYNGWALCGDRRWDQDAAWLDLSAYFARRVDAEAVLVWTFGTFVPNGNFWDFGGGRLQRFWNQGAGLSVVGERFSRLTNRRTGALSPAVDR